jgi:hypothetical protein
MAAATLVNGAGGDAGPVPFLPPNTFRTYTPYAYLVPAAASPCSAGR